MKDFFLSVYQEPKSHTSRQAFTSPRKKARNIAISQMAPLHHPPRARLPRLGMRKKSVPPGPERRREVMERKVRAKVLLVIEGGDKLTSPIYAVAMRRRPREMARDREISRWRSLGEVVTRGAGRGMGRRPYLHYRAGEILPAITMAANDPQFSRVHHARHAGSQNRSHRASFFTSVTPFFRLPPPGHREQKAGIFAGLRARNFVREIGKHKLVLRGKGI